MTERSAEAPITQREAQTRFGRFALQSDDLQAILTEACRLCTQAMDTPLAKVLQVQEDGRHLTVVAGVGWDAGIVGEEVIPILSSSSEGQALRRRKPAITENIEDEDRFDYAGFLKDHGVEAMINVVIPGAEERPPYGLLEVDAREPRDFTDSDIEFLQGYANILGAAVERHEHQRRLTQALEEKERLLHELQHRVMNNLDVLGSMLRIKARKTRHPAVQREIAELQSQIDVLAELHRQLFAARSSSEVDLGSYLAALGTGIAGFASNNHTRVEVKTRTESVLVDAELAIPLGIVVNEFVTNSVKHASIDGRAEVSLCLAVEEGALSISLSDGGPGLGDALHHVDDEDAGSGLGLIEGMLRQIGGEWTWSYEGSAGLSISIPLSLRSVTEASSQVA